MSSDRDDDKKKEHKDIDKNLSDALEKALYKMQVQEEEISKLDSSEAEDKVIKRIARSREKFQSFKYRTFKKNERQAKHNENTTPEEAICDTILDEIDAIVEFYKREKEYCLCWKHHHYKKHHYDEAVENYADAKKALLKISELLENPETFHNTQQVLDTSVDFFNNRYDNSFDETIAIISKGYDKDNRDRFTTKYKIAEIIMKVQKKIAV